MKRYKLIIRIGKQAVKEVTIRTANLFTVKSIIQKHNVKLIGVKPL
jgi:hypothetical protein